MDSGPFPHPFLSHLAQSLFRKEGTILKEGRDSAAGEEIETGPASSTGAYPPGDFKHAPV
jgi:hypothetical protein